MKSIKINGYKRVSKREARKAYNNGNTIRLTPCNMRPDNMWGVYADANVNATTEVLFDGFNTTVARERDFDTVCNAFAYYNCATEMGRYPAFYVKES